jgi:hypothetical protein
MRWEGRRGEGSRVPVRIGILFRVNYLGSEAVPGPALLRAMMRREFIGTSASG